jgi:transaldolase
MPPATLEALRDHGRVRASIEDHIESAHAIMAALEEVGISLREVTDQLLSEGVQLFAEPFDKLLDALAQHSQIRA